MVQQKQKILRRGRKNTQRKYTKNDLNDLDNHYGGSTTLHIPGCLALGE